MSKIKLFQSRAVWILILNGILILIPISGFYFIYTGDYQSLHRRTVNLYTLNDSITGIINFINSEEAVSEAPVFAPYQRILVVENGHVMDTNWQSNPYYQQTNPFFSFISKLFLKEITPPDLKQEEILSRLSTYIESKIRKTGIINYRFMYSVMPFYRSGGKAGSSIVLIDKSDIMQMTTLNKIVLLLISILSGIIALVISFIHYFLFIKPLSHLTKEALAFKNHGGESPDSFPLRNRNDEVGRLSQAFYQSASELIRKRELIESFTSDVLHEVKNPLTAIRNGVEILEQKNDFREKNMTGVILNIISRETGRIEKLLYDIKELSFYENQHTGTESCNPGEVIREVASMYHDHGIKIDIKAKSVRSIAMPREKLGCVLKNLIDNAIDFSPESGSVTVSYEQSGNSAMVTVSDTGKGIPDIEKQKVFRRFYSHRKGAEASGLHSGLGLSIVEKILQCYDFSIQCHDNNPSGCRFVITF
ncbi:MAG: HAMP domain-containing histidine kinase [Spirochaetales bacterium]|nr:HAMP domain-containing histidine kinase [Spirochaetales bacterium]